MMSTARRALSTNDLELTLQAKLSSANAVFTLSLILTQATSPGQVMRLLTTAIPSIAPGHKAVAWHPSRSGDYYERAPDGIADTLSRLTVPDRLDMGGLSCWAFPLAPPSARDRIFLIIEGAEPLSEEETFLLSVLAQLTGTVIVKLELIGAERANVQRVAALNAELQSTVSKLTKVMEIHRRLNEIVVEAGETGIAETLHQLTTFPVLIQDVHGNTRAAFGYMPSDHPVMKEPPEQRRELIGRLQIVHRAVYHRQAWVVLANPRADALGVIALIDPARNASEIDLAALEYAATVLSVELGRLQSMAEAELRSQAARERDIAQARAAELASSEARQRAILEAAIDAVISIDRRARLTYVNSAFEHTFGYRAGEVIGREIAQLIVPPSLREAHRQGFARYLQSGQSRILNQRIEITAMRADGSKFPAELTVTRTGPTGEPAFTGYVRDITERRRAQQELIASRARLVAASDTARRRITRDLHDGAQQRFVTTIINLQLADQKWESAPQRAKELLGLALRDAKRGIEDLRDIVAGIHPAILTQRGLAAAIDALAARLPIPVQLDMPDYRLPAPIEASAYFFCCEALTNVVRHAHATSAWVRVDVENDRCYVEVRDDGIGGARPRSEASGLNGLFDRIGALNGTVDITSPAAGGTVLRASIPLPS